LSTTTTGTPSGTDTIASRRWAEEFQDTIATRTRGTVKPSDDSAARGGTPRAA